MAALLAQDVYRSVLSSVERLETGRLALPRQAGKKAFASYSDSARSGIHDDSANLPGLALEYTEHARLELAIGVQGRAELAMAGQRYAVAEGDVAIVPGGTLHLERILSRRQNYHLLWLCVWPDRMTIHSSIYHRANRFQVVRRGCIPRCGAIWRCMENAAEEAVARNDYGIHMVRARLAEGLVRSLRTMEEKGCGLNAGQTHRSSVDAAKSFMQGHFSEDLTLDRISEKVFLSPSYFSALFSRSENQTVFEYLHDIRIDEAKRLLTDTNLPIKQIARRVGIPSASYFCRLFRRIAGQPAHDFRVHAKCCSDPKIGQF